MILLNVLKLYQYMLNFLLGLELNLWYISL